MGDFPLVEAKLTEVAVESHVFPMQFRLPPLPER